MEDHSWVPDGVPLDRPSPARMYDYLLGGYHNFQFDRDRADAVEKLFPYVRLAAQVNRAFLRRAVTFLVEEGCDQFLDLGSGIPTVGNVHEVAQALNPQARIAYVDIDPVAVAHSQSLLADNPWAVAIRADARNPHEILSHPDVRRLLDLEKPVALLMVALLHYIVNDAEAEHAVSSFCAAAAPGSYMAIAHPIIHREPPEVEAAFAELVKRGTRTSDRAPEHIARFFGDWSLVPPGLVLTPLWRPEGPSDPLIDTPEQGWTMAGVAKKP